MNIPPELNQRYHDGSLIPFIGAGISMSVKWKDNGQTMTGISWKELVDKAAELLGACEPDLLRVRGSDLQILEYYKIKNNGFDTLTNWLVRRLNPKDEDLKLSKIHQEIANLDKCKIFYTTNYDDFLERSLIIHGKQTHIIAKEADIKKIDLETIVVKFHGDFNNLDRMVLSEDDYKERLSFEDEMDYRLRSDILGKAALFLGYSFSDQNVSYLFHLLNKKFKGLPHSSTGKRAYIAIPDPSDFEKRLFNARNIEVIPLKGSDIANEIVKLLRALKS